MAITKRELLKAAIELAKIEELRITIDESAKAASVAGSGALIGGLLGGPRGLAIGGIVGSILGAYSAFGKFKSVVSVILEDMSQEQREEFAHFLYIAFRDINASNALELIDLVTRNEAIKERLIRAIAEYLENNMGLVMELTN